MGGRWFQIMEHVSAEEQLTDIHNVRRTGGVKDGQCEGSDRFIAPWWWAAVQLVKLSSMIYGKTWIKEKTQHHRDGF